MPVVLKRVYAPPAGDDGSRVLVDRLWPRGLSREKAAVDLWLKDVAPSDALRKCLHRDPSDWNAFRRAYLAELKQYREQLKPLVEKAERGRVTLLFASRNETRNNAVVLKEYLHRLGAP